MIKTQKIRKAYKAAAKGTILARSKVYYLAYCKKQYVAVKEVTPWNNKKPKIVESDIFYVPECLAYKQVDKFDDGTVEITILIDPPPRRCSLIGF